MAPVHDRRAGFSRRRQYSMFIGYVLAVAGAVVGGVLLVASRFDPPLFAGMRMAAAGVTAPVSSGLSAIGRGLAVVPETINGWIFAHQENAAMKRELAVTRPLLSRARVIAYDNRRLRTLLALRDRDEQVVVTSRLVSSSASSGRRFALLNAGRLNGVLPGMPVRGPEGLIGRITETGLNAARVLLLSDPDSIVPVRRTRDGLPAIVAGRGDGAVDLRSVNATNVRFSPGDLFVTSGTGGLYAPGIPVARVVKGGSDTVIARTFAQPDSFDFALVSRVFVPLPPPPPTPAAAP
ncbi:rod shape-determining protein MreC [Microvirga sp. SRT01]|uniref:Cell shape-determining protein MreC n=1 Tax=Sphingomonas longa TaxID=2778730 RepID=A0ABS2D2U0_9SPHN|nr:MULTISPECIES: rod shape-determining protein MreC [Alphaproteobacteria]MBM6575222.1 rod shape-determining protein MreC [Sphingomonas sp. BT552]MBR7708272.1 rod shape-determining protein MreC [Microvirga sp. SRT01]